MFKFICTPINHHPHFSSWTVLNKCRPNRPPPWRLHRMLIKTLFSCCHVLSSVMSSVGQRQIWTGHAEEGWSAVDTFLCCYLPVPVHWQQFKTSFPGRTQSYHSDGIDYSHGLHQHKSMLELWLLIIFVQDIAARWAEKIMLTRLRGIHVSTIR